MSKGSRRAVAAMAMAMALLAATPAVQAEDPAVQPRKTGGGTVTGTMTYVGKPLPKLLTVCERNLAYTLDGWRSDAFVFEATVARYAGPVTMTGGGGSHTSCESYSLGGGRMTVALRGHNPLTGSTLDCRDDYGDLAKSQSVRGQYVRVATDLEAVLTGRCVVDGHAVGQVSFFARIKAVPSDAAGGEGVTRPVWSMATAGALTLVPA